MTGLLSVADVDVAYGGIQAVRLASLEVGSGELVAVIGRNGAGKSSLVNCISGLVPSSGGTMSFEGLDITKAPAWRRARAGVALVPEGRRIFVNLSVQENLEFGQRRARRRSLSSEVMELFPDLEPLMDRPGDRISGGQQQMVAIGRALMCDPKLLILDEPSLGLAPKVVDGVFGAILKIVEQGISVLLIEQNAIAALSMATSAYAMSSGVLVPISTGGSEVETSELLKHYM